jgi:DNA (cytosine-5)-methyltransferase 1
VPRGRTRDSVVALDMFSGAGGSSQGIEAAGIDVWYAANHWDYAVRLHEANHPGAEHFVADLVDTEATDYYHPEHLPRADLLWASPSCTNHSTANATRAYERNLSLFDIHDETYEAEVTHSERSRATAVCVLQYARKHQPKVIVVENVVEFCQWGRQVGNSRKGDGSTFRWWLGELHALGYETRVLFLNSMFLGVPQSRDRVYIACWQRGLRTPDLDFRPRGWCGPCDADVETRQTFKARTAAWPLPEWGKYGDQYTYTCPSCRREVKPYSTPAAAAIDWTDLGNRIGDKGRRLADSTMSRIKRGVDKYFNSGEWPAVLMPAKGVHGIERSTTQPMPTQTTQQEMMLLSAFQAVLAGHAFEHPGSSGCRARPIDAPMPTQHTTQSNGIVIAPPAFLDNYQGAPRTPAEALPTQLGSETLGLVVPMLHTMRGSHPGREACLETVAQPMTTVSAGGNHHFLLSALFAKQNGGPADTAWHQAAVDSLNTLLGVDTTCLVIPPREKMPPVDVDDCYYRMLKPTEIKAGMGIPRAFKMWGTARDQVRALGNAVTPPASEFIVGRMAGLLG